MTDATISDLTMLNPPMTGTELLEIERSGSSYKIEAGQLASCPPAAVAITSGSVSQDLDPLAGYYEITTGGTGGVELLNLPNLVENGDGMNAANIGRLLTVTILAQTDPGDSVKITVDGSDFIQFWQPTRQDDTHLSPFSTSTGAILGFSSATMTFVWIGDNWVINSFPSQWDNTVADASQIVLIGFPDVAISGAFASSGTAGLAQVLGGWSHAANQAGHAVITGGKSTDASGTPGDVIISAGPNHDSSAFGNIILDTLPTADPLATNALWNDGGNPKLSGAPAGASGTFTTSDLKTVTVTNGVITSIV